jgi:hypothetical protein
MVELILRLLWFSYFLLVLYKPMFKLNQKLAFHATPQGAIYQMLIEFEKEGEIVKTLDLKFDASKVSDSLKYTAEEQELKTKVESMVRDRLVSTVSELCKEDVRNAVRDLGYDPDTGEELPKTQAEYMLKYYQDLSTPMNLRHQPVDITSDK